MAHKGEAVSLELRLILTESCDDDHVMRAVASALNEAGRGLHVELPVRRVASGMSISRGLKRSRRIRRARSIVGGTR